MDGTIFIAAFYSFVWSGLLDLYFHEFFKEKSMLIEEDVDKEKKQIHLYCNLIKQFEGDDREEKLYWMEKKLF